MGMSVHWRRNGFLAAAFTRASCCTTILEGVACLFFFLVDLFVFLNNIACATGQKIWRNGQGAKQKGAFGVRFITPVLRFHCLFL